MPYAGKTLHAQVVLTQYTHTIYAYTNLVLPDRYADIIDALLHHRFGVIFEYTVLKPRLFITYVCIHMRACSGPI